MLLLAHASTLVFNPVERLARVIIRRKASRDGTKMDTVTTVLFIFIHNVVEDRIRELCGRKSATY